MTERRATPPCVLCGTMTDVFDDDGHSWKCGCGRTTGVTLNSGNLDLGFTHNSITIMGEPATLVDRIAVLDPAVFVQHPRGEG